MFNFLKRLVKPQVPETQSITIDELPSWLAQQRQARTDAAHKDFETTVTQLREQLGLLGTSISALRSAELLNPNIPERAKQVMEGNREAFLRAVEQLYDLRLPLAMDDVPRFQDEFKTTLHELLPAVSRPFQILQEFFANESKDVWNSVHLVEKQALALGNIGKTHKLDALTALAAELDTRQKLMLQKTEAAQQILTAEETLTQLAKEHKRAQENILALEQSEDYKRLLAVKEKLQHATSSIKDLRAKLSEQFSALEPALKKYEHMTLHNRQLIRDYLQNPVETLARDRELAILQVIAAMRREVEADRIDLKDRRKEKVLAAMTRLDKDALNGFLKEYGTKLGEQNRLVAEADSLDVLHRISAARKHAQSIEEQRSRVEKTKSEAQLLASQEFSNDKIAAVLKEHFSLELR